MFPHGWARTVRDRRGETLIDSLWLGLEVFFPSFFVVAGHVGVV